MILFCHGPTWVISPQAGLVMLSLSFIERGRLIFQEIHHEKRPRLWLIGHNWGLLLAGSSPYTKVFLPYSRPRSKNGLECHWGCVCWEKFSMGKHALEYYHLFSMWDDHSPLDDKRSWNLSERCSHKFVNLQKTSGKTPAGHCRSRCRMVAMNLGTGGTPSYVVMVGTPILRAQWHIGVYNIFIVTGW